MAQLTLSLSRAHKISERIATRMNELYAESNALAAVKNVTGMAGESQVAKLTEQGQRAVEAHNLAEKYSEALTQLRIVIGAENQARGVNALLARQAGLNRTLSNLKKLIAQGKAAGIEPTDLAHYKPLSEASRLGNMAVSVVVVGAETVVELEQQYAQAKRDFNAVSDQVSEANAHRFTVELADDIAAEVTGA